MAELPSTTTIDRSFAHYELRWARVDRTIDVERVLELRERVFAPDHTLYSLLHDSPNDDMTAQSFWTALVSSMLFNGEGYGEIKMTETTDRVISIEYLEFEKVSWSAVDKDRQYRVTDANGRQRQPCTRRNGDLVRGRHARCV